MKNTNINKKIDKYSNVSEIGQCLDFHMPDTEDSVDYDSRLWMNNGDKRLFYAISGKQTQMLCSSVMYEIDSGSSITFQLYASTVYLCSTYGSLETYRTFAILFGGNYNNTNNSQKATINQLVTSDKITYSISGESGKYNYLTITNNDYFKCNIILCPMNGQQAILK